MSAGPYTFKVQERDVFLHRSEGAPATFHHTTYDVVRDDGKVVRSGMYYYDSAVAVASSLTQARYPRKEEGVKHPNFNHWFIHGGDHVRALAQVRLARSHAEHLNLDYAAGGPLDAVTYVPAGGWDSTNTIDARSQPVAQQSYTVRS